MPVVQPRLVSMLSLLLIAGCVHDCKVGLDTAGVSVDTANPWGDDSDPSDTAADSGDTVPPGLDGTVQGTIEVTLFRLDEQGDVAVTAWEDSCFGDSFPYGDIIVTAYVTDEETGLETYYGDYTIHDPSVDPSENTYSIVLDTEEVDEIYLYAVLDKWDDRIISPSDPVGIHGDPVRVSGGGVVDGIDIEILTDYWCGFDDGSGSGSGSGSGACPDCPPHWGDGGGWYWDGDGWVYLGPGWYWDGEGWVYGDGGSSSGSWGHGGVWGGSDPCGGNVTVGGDLLITVPYNGTGTDVATILYWPGTEEPWSANLDIEVEGDSSGASGDWGHLYACNGGTFPARGVWDDNGNGLYDPTDTWGQPVDNNGIGLATISFGEEDELEQELQIPIEGADFGLVPFVRLSGELGYHTGRIDDLLEDNPDVTVYVAALKYATVGDLDVTSFDDAYDFEAFRPEDLAGLETLPYTLLAPAEVVTYLWAGADLDNDGMLNEPGEPVTTTPGDSDSRISTGSTNQSGLDLTMVNPGS
jgi:hypothetical protein